MGRAELFSAVIATVLFLSGAARAEYTLGDVQAPVTIVEYASLTCDYCVRFHVTVFPLIKSRHIDTGRVRFVYRDFPTGDAALRGAVAVRCAGPRRHFAMLDVLYSAVGRWSRASDVDAALAKQAESLELDAAAFRACLDDPQHERSIHGEQRRAVTEHGVLGTPTFIINGEIVRGAKNIDEIEALIERASK